MPNSGPIALQVLIIDDNDSDRATVLRDLGRMEGVEITAVFAESGRDAMTTLVSHLPFDIIITDKDMPGMSLWDLLAGIRAQAKTPQGKPVPIIVQSGALTEEIEKRAKDEFTVSALIRKSEGTKEWGPLHFRLALIDAVRNILAETSSPAVPCK